MSKPSTPTDPAHPCYEHRWTCDRCHLCLDGECCELDHPKERAKRDGTPVLIGPTIQAPAQKQEPAPVF